MTVELKYGKGHLTLDIPEGAEVSVLTPASVPVIEDLPAGMYPDRPWDVGNNPKTAVREFLAGRDDFEVDEDMEAKLLITVAPGGYLRRR